ncbi:MAG: DUF1772 domain-containing protein [Myxococcota bacterium]|nr:DUF1772 domain-containing protein [Myxococcota bacterium]
MTAGRARLAAIVRGVNLFLVGLLAGAMFLEYFIVAVLLAELPAAQWVGLHARFALIHPFTIIPLAVLATVSLVVVFVVERGADWVTRGAAVFFVAIVVLTAGVMMPVNDAIVGWTIDGIPDDWSSARDRWNVYQAIRASLSIVGFALLVTAALSRRDERIST